MRIGEKVTNPGELDIWIELYSRSVATQTGGFQTPSLVLLAGVWSKWRNVHGQEAWVASSIMAESPATITIRYRSDIDETCVVKCGGLYFEIVSLDNIEQRNEYIELKVKRWKARVKKLGVRS